MSDSHSSKEGTDWAWCFENPREAASEIDRLNEEIQCLYGTIEAFERAADEPGACNSDDGMHECKECDHRWGGKADLSLDDVNRYAQILRIVPAGEKVSAEMIPVLLAQLQAARSTFATLADADGPGEEDGPWAEGWHERAAQPPSASHPVCIYRGGCQRPDCTDLCLGFRREAEPPYDHGLALNAQQITISLRQRCKCLEGYRGCVMCVAATFIERASAPGASETKSACTCPPGYCCDRSGAAKSEQRICRDAHETPALHSNSQRIAEIRASHEVSAPFKDGDMCSALHYNRAREHRGILLAEIMRLHKVLNLWGIKPEAETHT